MEQLKEMLNTLALSIASQESNIPKEDPSPSKCKLCDDTGYVAKDGKHSGMVECACALEKRVDARLPKRFRQASLLNVSEVLRTEVMDWFAKPGDGLFIMGPAGRGKTYLAAAIVRTLVMIAHEALFLRCADFYSDLRASYQSDMPERGIYAKYSKYRILVLDDLGAGGLSDFQRYSMTEFLDQRINKEFPTIVTSNWNLEQISEKMDERIASRLSSFHHIVLEGPDRRVNAQP